MPSQPTLLGALTRGATRPRRSVMAQLGEWLGQTVMLKDGAFWQSYYQAIGAASYSGERVTVQKTLTIATAQACVRLIAETIATLPLALFRRVGKDREPAYNHPLYELLHNQPNADMTAVVFWEVVCASLLLWGNAYIEVIRSRGTVIALNFLHPACITIRLLAGGAYEYIYSDPILFGAQRTIAEDDVMHVLAFSLDGRCGLSPIVYGAATLGAAIEGDRVAAETFHDGMRSPGIITMDHMLKPAQREDIRAHVDKVSKEGGVMVLEKGTGFEKLGFDPVSAELLDSRRWNAEEVCRLYGIDPAMVGLGQKDSNWGTGLEQKMNWFVIFTLRKWCVRIEQAIRSSLLTPVERREYFSEFNLEGLLRGDSAARATFYSSLTQNGIMTRDEARAKENLPLMGGNADVLTVQANMLPLDKLGQARVGAVIDPTAPPPIPSGAAP